MKNTKFSHRWTVACQNSFVDRESNNLSLISILEELRFNIPNDHRSEGKEVVFPISLDLVSFWDNNLKLKGHLDYCVSFFSPQKKELWNFTPQIDCDENKERLRTIIKVNGLKATAHSGRYEFVVKQKTAGVGYKEVCRVPIDIVVKKA